MRVDPGTRCHMMIQSHRCKRRSAGSPRRKFQKTPGKSKAQKCKYGRNMQKTTREKQLGCLRLMVPSQILSTARIFFSCSAAQQPERIRGKTYFASDRRPQRHWLSKAHVNHSLASQLAFELRCGQKIAGECHHCIVAFVQWIFFRQTTRTEKMWDCLGSVWHDCSVSRSEAGRVVWGTYCWLGVFTWAYYSDDLAGHCK